jgi:hypothetical protein
MYRTGQINGDILVLSLTRKSQELSGQLGRASGRPFNHVCGLKNIVAWARILLEQIGITEDAGQQVIEVVGNSPRQPANRFHFLALAKLHFELGLLFFCPTPFQLCRRTNGKDL